MLERGECVCEHVGPLAPRPPRVHACPSRSPCSKKSLPDRVISLATSPPPHRGYRHPRRRGPPRLALPLSLSMGRIHSPAIVLPLRWRYKHQYNMKQTGKERQPPKRHRRTEFAALCWGVTARGSLCPSRCPCEWLPRETASSHGGRTRGFSHRRTSSFLPVRVSA